MLKLRIISKEEDQKFHAMKAMRKNRYIIGQSELEGLDEAVRIGFEYGIHPLIAEKNNNLRDKTMERYASLLVIYAMNRYEQNGMKICPDSCRADLMFSNPAYSDKYMGIQVKTTGKIKSHKRKGGNTTYDWRFSKTGKDYSGLLLYMRCVSEGESWLIPYNILCLYITTIDISIAKTEKPTNFDWNKYKIKDCDLASVIFQYFLLGVSENPCVVLESSEKISTPVSEKTQKEHETRKKLLPLLSETNLQIESPPLEDMPYDFIWGELKVQEKPSSQNEEGHSYLVHLHYSKGAKRIKEPYRLEHFGILIVHNPSPYDNSFYCIPSIKIDQHGHFKTDINKGATSLYVFPSEDFNVNNTVSKRFNWTFEFICYYDDPNIIQRLLAIYNMQLYGIIEPIVLQNCHFWDFPCKNLNDLVIKWNLERTFTTANNKYQMVFMKKRVLEKTLEKQEHRFKMYLTCYKSAETLKDDTCDYLYSKMPESYNGFYMIPLPEFSKRKMLKNDNNVGQTSVIFPFPNTSVQNDNVWINNFIFSFTDNNFPFTISALFSKYS